MTRLRAFLAFLALALPLHTALPADLADLFDDDGDNLLDAVEEAFSEGDAEWWDAAWPYRRKLVIEDPGLPLRQPPVVAVSNPDPLLLYNSGRCRRDLADVRAVSIAGTVLRSGVAHFGRDDGTAAVWFVCDDGAPGMKVAVYLYYGNPDAEAGSAALPAVPVPEVAATVGVGAEEIREGATLPARAQRGSFFTNIVVIEAEQFAVASEADARAFYAKPEAGASAGLVAVRRGVAAPEQLTVRTTAGIPSAGKWYVHLRCRNRPGNPDDPCDLLVNGRPVELPLSDDPEAPFLWGSADLSLAAGEAEFALRISGSAAPDCLLMTQDPDYLPDYRDVTGPVWMRFRASAEIAPPFYVHLYGMHTPYSAEGMKGDTACWVFRDRIALTETDSDALAREADTLIQGGEWSAWGKALHSRAYTWFSRATLVVPDAAGKPAGAGELDVEFEFATRPDSSRVFRHGVEEVGTRRQVHVRMPTSLAWSGQGGLPLTESFGQWARRRFRMAEELGFAQGEGPTNIVAGTMAQAAYTKEELEYLLKTSSWLGLNLLDTWYHDQQVLNELADRHGIHWTMDHHLAYGVGAGGVTNADAGQSYAETLEARLSDAADEVFATHARRAASQAGPPGPAPDRYPQVRYGVLGDEIAEVINSISINQSPFNRSLFLEFLQARGLEPAFLGAESWDALRAMDYATLHPKTVENMEKRLAGIQATLDARRERDRSLEAGIDGGAADPELDALVADVTGEDGEDEAAALAALSDDDRKFLDWAAEVQRNEDAKERMGEGLATPPEKRLYHWTQRFKNDYYCTYFRVVSEAARRHYPPPFNASVNLQAMPVQGARMWNGQCNIFELGRKNAFDTLHVEDWDGRTLHVAFAMNVLRAAARKNGQPLTALITGANPSKRIIANMAQGTRHLLFYLYGPIHCIGPVWAEHQPTLQQIGGTLRQVARCEADILAASSRPSDAAVLVANTTEVNATYRVLGFAAERRALYRSLLEAHVPVDVVGEEEIIEDDALARYRLLCIGDSHVDSRAQRRIRDWVEAGGVLLATGSASSYQEYDERSAILNEVFGLEAREPGAPPSTAQEQETVEIGFQQTPWFSPLDAVAASALPRLDVSDGADVCATVTDGAPAVIHRAFGRGHAFLAAFRLASLTAAEGKSPGSEVSRGLVSGAARVAEVREHVRIDGRPGVWTWVHDGPSQSVVYVINEIGNAMEDGSMEVVVSRPVARVYSGSREAIEVTPGTGGAVVPLSLEPGAVEIIVLRHASGL